MSINYDEFLKWAPAASAVASAIAAIAAAVNVGLQNRNTRRNRSIDLLLKKEADFDSPRMHKARAGAAKALLAAKSYADDNIDCVLDFMEGVAGRVIGGDLEEDLAWSSFHHWFTHYYYAASEIIRRTRTDDRSVWCDLVDLHERMEKLQARRGSPLRNNLPGDIKDFLESEAKLLD